jgi:hypothetical protein
MRWEQSVAGVNVSQSEIAGVSGFSGRGEQDVNYKNWWDRGREE